MDIIKDLNFDKSKPMSSPLPKGLSLATKVGDVLSEPGQFRKLIGRLLYLNIYNQARLVLCYTTPHPVP